MKNVVYLKTKHNLRLEFIENVKEAEDENAYTELVENYLCTDGNGWTYEINLAEANLAFWRYDDKKEPRVDNIDMMEFSNTGKPTLYLNKAYLDDKVIFDMKDYTLKSYMWYDDEEDEYYHAYYICPKGSIVLPSEIELNLQQLREKGHIVGTDSMLEKLKEVANKEYDGHFTLMKFTTNWRCKLGTVNSYESIMEMSSGKTMEEAIARAIEDRDSLE